MNETQVALRAAAEAFAQLDMARARIRDLEAECERLRERLIDDDYVTNAATERAVETIGQVADETA